jgi:hypothetical protein
MKKNVFEKLKFGWLFAILLSVVFSLVGVVDAGAMCADAAAIPGGGITEQEPASYQSLDENSPEILLNTVDSEIVKIRPHLFPANSIASEARVKLKRSNNPKYKYYSIAALPLEVKVATAYTQPTNGDVTKEINFGEANDLIAINETLYFPTIAGAGGGFFVAKVKDKDSSGKPILSPNNGPNKGTGVNVMPALAAGDIAYRGGRSGTEFQIDTDSFSVTPTPKEQFLQKFLFKTEESTQFLMADKEVTWSKTEITNEAIFEHKQTQYLDFWLGKKLETRFPNKWNDNKTEQAFFAEGIWWQAGKDFSFSGSPVNKNKLVTMMKEIFVGNASSNTKVLLAGKDLIEAFHQVDYDQSIYMGKDSVTEGLTAGLSFKKIVSFYGTLLLCHDQALNEWGFEGKGLVIDPEYFVKVTEGIRTYDCDNRKILKSDSIAQVFVETCALVLKNADAHTRISLT